MSCFDRSHDHIVTTLTIVGVTRNIAIPELPLGCLMSKLEYSQSMLCMSRVDRDIQT